MEVLHSVDDVALLVKRCRTGLASDDAFFELVLSGFFVTSSIVVCK